MLLFDQHISFFVDEIRTGILPNYSNFNIIFNFVNHSICQLAQVANCNLPFIARIAIIIYMNEMKFQKKKLLANLFILNTLRNYFDIKLRTMQKIKFLSRQKKITISLYKEMFGATRRNLSKNHQISYPHFQKMTQSNTSKSPSASLIPINFSGYLITYQNSSVGQ